MIVKLEDAKKYYCCTSPLHKCKGNKCMAWKTYFTEKQVGKQQFPQPPEVVATDKGYCGLTK